ncbi:zf-HC2 domain-containing protein [Streptomyces ovatisporus]|uniref:Zf-HC2 domain-containing protein n=1 Tax=Streptomyces ovatisporus TaxID=1128682 RepID=A0ABV9ACW2_9ACTN
MSRRRTAAAWHVSDGNMLAYAANSLAETDCWSIEKHLEACSSCAREVSAAVLAGAAAPELARTRDAVMALAGAEAGTGRTGALRGRRRRRDSRTGAALRGWAVRFGWAAGPTLRLPWLLALVAVAALAVVMARVGEIAEARPLLLMFAPVLPLSGPALSYSRYADPLHEVAASTPSGGLRLLLIRTAAVLGVSTPLVTVTGFLLPAAPGTPGAATWLLPALALTLATLTLGSYTGCRYAAAGISATWLAAVALASRTGLVPGTAGGASGEPFRVVLAETLNGLFSGPAAQGGWAVAAALCAGLVALRRTSFGHLERL